MRSLPTPDDLRSREQIVDQSQTLVTVAMGLVRAVELLASVQLSSALKPPDISGGIDFYQEVTRFEVTLIREALRYANGNQKEAAKLLRLNHTTLNCKVKQYKINPKVISFSSDMEPSAVVG